MYKPKNIVNINWFLTPSKFLSEINSGFKRNVKLLLFRFSNLIIQHL